MQGAEVGSSLPGRFRKASRKPGTQDWDRVPSFGWLNEKPRGREQMPVSVGIELIGSGLHLNSASFGSVP